ncbi:MAG TPA: hypothetical protein VGJ97_07945 [Anaerolineaceae bacterium]|jgi:hypothetical protein
MPDAAPSPAFLQQVEHFYQLPSPDPRFLASLRSELVQAAAQAVPLPAAPLPRRPQPRLSLRRPAWAVAFAVLLLLAVAMLAIGPQRVLAAFRQWFGYLPGVGIVDTTAPIRILAEPVQQTREGITVSVNRVILTADRTQLDSSVSGVPLSAYPKDEAVRGCIEPEYLRLPDGTRLDPGFPVPPGVNEATLVLPCIDNTLPGTVPTDWELPLRFTAAPPDLTVMPILDLTPTRGVRATQPSTSIAPTQGPKLETSIPAAPQAAALTIEKVIETEDGYILLGALRPQGTGGAGILQNGQAVLRDAAGKEVVYTRPQDILPERVLELKPSDQAFALQFSAPGVSFPLTFSIPGATLYEADPQASVELAFEAGPEPLPGQTWELNQEIELAGHPFRLSSVRADSRNGYSFEFEVNPDVYSVGVQIKGYTPIGNGGSFLIHPIHTRLSFAELPKGSLTLVLSHLVVASAPQTWQVQWQPGNLRSDGPTTTPAPSPVCLSADGFDQLSSVPAGMSGQALLAQQTADGRAWSLGLAHLDGSQAVPVAPPDSPRGTLSPDGKFVAYPGSGGTTFINLVSGEKRVLPGITGSVVRWSPDGRWLAFTTSENPYGIFVISLYGETKRQLTHLGSETLAGWSPDGTQLYYAIPGAAGEGWLLKAVDVATGAGQDLFPLNSSSIKAPLPAVSPDGHWVAYRGKDNASLYLIQIDGTQQRLVVEKAGSLEAIGQPVWSLDGSWLGMTVMSNLPEGDRVLLVQPAICQTYLAPGLQGDLQGLIIP